MQRTLAKKTWKRKTKLKANTDFKTHCKAAFLHARLQQYVNYEFPDVQAGFSKGRGTRDQIANIRWIMEKSRTFQKKIYFCFIDYAKPLTVWITTDCGKF